MKGFFLLLCPRLLIRTFHTDPHPRPRPLRSASLVFAYAFAFKTHSPPPPTRCNEIGFVTTHSHPKNVFCKTGIAISLTFFTSSPLAQPRNFVGGHVISAIVGVFCSEYGRARKDEEQMVGSKINNSGTERLILVSSPTFF